MFDKGLGLQENVKRLVELISAEDVDNRVQVKKWEARLLNALDVHERVDIAFSAFFGAIFILAKEDGDVGQRAKRLYDAFTMLEADRRDVYVNRESESFKRFHEVFGRVAMRLIRDEELIAHHNLLKQALSEGLPVEERPHLGLPLLKRVVIDVKTELETDVPGIIVELEKYLRDNAGGV